MQVKFEDSGTPLKRSKNRRGETCEEQLRRMCKRIADDITEKAITRYNGWETEHDEDDEGTLASRFMEHVYDIRYLVDSQKRFLGAELLVAGGGPTIWVDTFREQVTGWWGTDRVQIYFQDNLGLNDYCEEMYG
tara:strand:+ start:1891 stop:2292 length:402 start_codon:yes stop_codon:yes gene_type:complete